MHFTLQSFCSVYNPYIIITIIIFYKCFFVFIKFHAHYIQKVYRIYSFIYRFYTEYKNHKQILNSLSTIYLLFLLYKDDIMEKRQLHQQRVNYQSRNGCRQIDTIICYADFSVFNQFLPVVSMGEPL